jgi:hypothetical protein
MRPERIEHLLLHGEAYSYRREEEGEFVLGRAEASNLAEGSTAGFSEHDPTRMMHICGLDEGFL